MLREHQQRIAIGLAAKYFDRPTLSKAISEAAAPEGSLREVRRVNRLIHTANTLSSSGELDLDLINLSQLTQVLPKVFGWKDRKERKKWTAAFKETAGIVNSEIQEGFYKDPNEIDKGSVFLFYFLDGYSRWVATMVSQERNLEEDRNYSNTVINALCETAVVLAEQGESGAVDILKWINGQKWIEEKWGFSPELVKRAHGLSSDTSIA